MICRFCGATLGQRFVDLGEQPLSNGYLREQDLNRPEPCYPLVLYVCTECFLVQTVGFASSHNIFDAGYRYFSSVSSSWLKHAQQYASLAINKLGLGPDSLVMEVACNDGYLLQYFKSMGIPCIGVDPATATGDAARAKSIEVVDEFFDKNLAETFVQRGQRPDLLIGNNVLAHVPDLNNFVSGFKRILAKGGVVSLEFPHLLRLMRENQFDTIYHEHFSYFSFSTARKVLEHHGLTVVEVQELPTHGGSLRIWARHAEERPKIHTSVETMLTLEKAEVLDRPEGYQGFQKRMNCTCAEARAFVDKQLELGKTIAGYGAAAKGNTFLNTCGLGLDHLSFVADAGESKQGLYLPGSRIPIKPPEEIFQSRPDWLVILPWNIREEVMEQLKGIKEFGGHFVQFMPNLIID